MKTKEELIEEVKALRSRIENTGRSLSEPPPGLDEKKWTKIESIEETVKMLKAEFDSKTPSDKDSELIQDLRREIKEVRRSESEKIREIERLAAQESTCNSIMIFLQEMGQQLEHFSEEFKSSPDAEAFKEIIERAVKQASPPAAPDQARQAEAPPSAIGNSVLEKLNDIQFQFENFIAQASKPAGSGETPEDENIVPIMDLKIDRIIQQLEYLQQDYQDFKFTSSNASASGDVSEALAGMEEKIKQLGNEFNSKIKIDQKKDVLIDNLHKELQEYKNDIQKKFLQSIVMDIIQIIDNIRRLTSHYHQESTDNDPDKLLKLLEDIPTDLEDLFYMQGISPFTCETDTFDGTRQRVLKKIETSDKSKDKQVAESLRPGYEWDDKIIRPEMVAAYVYKAPEQPEEPEGPLASESTPEHRPEVDADEKAETNAVGDAARNETNEAINNEADR